MSDLNLKTCGIHVYAEPPRVKVADAWERAGRTGRLLATVFARQKWAVVLWDDKEDPSTFKAAGLLVESPQWVVVKEPAR